MHKTCMKRMDSNSRTDAVNLRFFTSLGKAMQTNNINLQGRVAAVTGGASGIGLAIVERFLASGAKVAVWDMNDAGRDKVVAELSGV
jgi:3-oxoacyl-ACP reductase-like protein